MTTTQICCSSMALIFVCVSMFASQGLAHDVPPPPTPKTDDPFTGLLPPGGFTDVKECWSSLQSIEGCVVEIFQSFSAGKIQPLGPACCKAIITVNDACWPKMFPFNPFFPPLIKSYCGAAAAAATPPPTPTPTVGSVAASLKIAYDHLPAPTPETDEGHLSFIGISPPGAFPDAQNCWSSLQSVEGCLGEIYQSFITGKIQPLGPVCCKAIVTVNDACWPKMFPFNPFFPPLIMSYCAVNAASPPPASTPSLVSTKTVG